MNGTTEIASKYPHFTHTKKCSKPKTIPPYIQHCKPIVEGGNQFSTAAITSLIKGAEGECSPLHTTVVMHLVSSAQNNYYSN